MACRHLIQSTKSRQGDECGRPIPCPIHSLRSGNILVADLVVVLERAIAERNYAGANRHSVNESGGLDIVCSELARAGTTS